MDKLLLIKRISLFTMLVAFVAYSYAVYTSRAPGDITGNAMAIRGKGAFQKYNCIACHQLYGLGGYMGPDLTNVLSEAGKGEAYAAAFLKSGTRRMPNFNLSDEEIACLLAYLRAVDATGVSPVRDFTVTAWGDAKTCNE
jgi:nitric oxide reductase subunit C